MMMKQNAEQNTRVDEHLFNELDLECLNCLFDVIKSNKRRLSLVDALCVMADKHLILMAGAATANDDKRFKDYAHTIMGSSGSLGLKRTAAYCKQLEDLSTNIDSMEMIGLYQKMKNIFYSDYRLLLSFYESRLIPMNSYYSFQEGIGRSSSP